MRGRRARERVLTLWICVHQALGSMGLPACLQPVLWYYSTSSTSYFPFFLYVSNWLRKLCNTCIFIWSVGRSVCFFLGQVSWQSIWRLPSQWGDFQKSKGNLSPQIRSTLLPWHFLKTSITTLTSGSVIRASALEPGGHRFDSRPRSCTWTAG